MTEKKVKKSRYLAALEDCEELIDRLESKSAVDFYTFSEVWREMSFSLIFCSRPSEGELVDFTEEVLMAAKACWMPPSHSSRRLLAAYLVYGLYFKQPVKDTGKFRITQKDWKEVGEYYKFVCTQNLPEHCYMFCKLIEHDAFTFCATPCELYLEKRSRHSDALEVQMKLSNQGLNLMTTSCLASFLNKGQFEKLTVIEDLYSKYKRRLQLKRPEFKCEQLSVDDLGHTLRSMCLQRTFEKCSTKPEPVNKPPEPKSIGERRQQLKNRHIHIPLRHSRPEDKVVDPSKAPLDELAYLHAQVMTGVKRKRLERGYHTVKIFRQCREAKELQRTGNYEVLHSKSTRSMHRAPLERNPYPSRPRLLKRLTLDQLTGAADHAVKVRKLAIYSSVQVTSKDEEKVKSENEESENKESENEESENKESENEESENEESENEESENEESENEESENEESENEESENEEEEAEEGYVLDTDTDSSEGDDTVSSASDYEEDDGDKSMSGVEGAESRP